MFEQARSNEEKSLIAFQFEQTPIRTTTKEEDGSVWFAARDVAAALNLKWTGHTLTVISKTWKRMVSYTTLQGKQKLTFINEPAVYKLAFRSNKPEAERFTNWVASEVLPAIRRTGTFTQALFGDQSRPQQDRVLLEALIENTRQLRALCAQMAVAAKLEGFLEHLEQTARTMAVAVEEVSKISRIETAVREGLDMMRRDLNKTQEKTDQRLGNTMFTQTRIEDELRRTNRKLASLEEKITDTKQQRAGIMGYLQTYLPIHETADPGTTTHKTEENAPETFYREACAADPAASIEPIFLYKVYKAWCYARYSQALGRGVFLKRLQAAWPAGIALIKQQHKRVIHGLKISPEITISAERRA